MGKSDLKSFKLSERKEYGRFYGDFRGVDFSTDHTQIDERRFAYLVNMWKNYFTDQGAGIETIPGFRKAFCGAISGGGTDTDNTVYAIHNYKKVTADGEKEYALIHIGKRLYVWDFSKATNVLKHMMLTVPKKVHPAYYDFELPKSIGAVDRISIWGNDEIYVGHGTLYFFDTTLRYSTDRTDLYEGQYITLYYYDEKIDAGDLAVFHGMAQRKSCSFVMNNRLYIIDGKNYLYFDGETVAPVLSEKVENRIKYDNWNTAWLAIASVRDKATAMEQYPVGTVLEVSDKTATVTEYIGTFVDFPGFGELFDPFTTEDTSTVGWLNVKEGEVETYGAAYVPTTYRWAVPAGVNANAGEEWESRNLLSPYFRMTFVGDGENKRFYLNEKDVTITEVRVNGEVVTKGITLVHDQGVVSFDTPPPKPSPEGDDNVVITAKKWWRGFDGGIGGNAETSKDMILGCTIAQVFDSRVFFSGNPQYPNHVFWCGLTDGYPNPTYIGAINYQVDGVGSSPITGMIAIADSLMVLHRDAENGGAVYYHTPQLMESDIIPKVYPMTQGLSGVGCLGACTSFLDDPVFVSRFGLEAMGQLSVRYERALEHRSYLVDSVLTKCDLSSACLEEWGGYLFLLVDGKCFIADSRQRFSHATGHAQYEWYYLEDIGVWEGQKEEAVYASELPLALQKPDGTGIDINWCPVCKAPASRCNAEGHKSKHVSMPLLIADAVWDANLYETVDKRGKAVSTEVEPTLELIETRDDDVVTLSYVNYVVQEDLHDNLHAYLVTLAGNYTGGTFHKAMSLKAMGDTLYFGTENGYLCAFNFDQRNERGEFKTDAYSFDERAILSGCATKMDNCGIPHLTKNTVRKSLVVKTKTMGRFAAKLKVRTNKKPYEQIARITSGTFALDDIDFADFSFDTDGETLFAVKEKEKRWVEKQYYFYSDEYLKPFSLYYVAFRYAIMGRYKG